MVAARYYPTDAVARRQAFGKRAGFLSISGKSFIPIGVENNDLKKVDNLKYQQNNPTNNQQELATIKLRYKKPDAQTSEELVKIISADNISENMLSENFRFSASVALFGMLLRDSQYKGVGDYKMVLNLAERSKGSDMEGYRSEFVRLVRTIH